MAHKGTSTFIMQRMTGVILLPFAAWFLFNVIAHAGVDYANARIWLSQPVNALLMGVFISIGALHMRIGVMEVIQDYIHGGLNGLLNALNWIAALGVIAITWWSLFTLAF